jgi:hypothetical protein
MAIFRIKGHEDYSLHGILVGDSYWQSTTLPEGIRHAIEFGFSWKIGSESLVQDDPFKYLIKYEKEWENNSTKIQSALKVQSRWINLSDDNGWRIDILKEMSMDEFLDFIKLDLLLKMIRLAINHPRW